MGFPKYKDLTKAEHDLLNEHYNHTKPVGAKLKNKTDDNTTVTFKFGQAGFSGQTATLKDLDAELNVKYEKGDVLVEGIAKSNQDLSTKVEFKPKKYLDNTKLVYTEKVNPTTKNLGVGLGVEYDSDRANFQTSLDFSYPKLETFNASAVVGKDDKAIGFDTKYSFAKQAFTYYNLALWRQFRTNLWALKFNMKADAKCPNFEVSYNHILRPDLKFAAKATCEPEANKSTVQIGGDWKIDSTTQLKTRLSTNNTLAAVYRKNLSSNLILSLSGEVNTNVLHTKTNTSNVNYGVFFEYSS